MSVPSTIKKIALQLFVVVVTAAISVVATLYFMSPGPQAAVTDTVAQVANHKTYEELASIVKGTPMADCVAKYKDFTNYVDYNEHTANLYIEFEAGDPAKSAQLLMLHCSSDVARNTYDTAYATFPKVPVAYYDEYVAKLPTWENCYGSGTLTAGHQCVIDGLNTFVSGVNAFAANEIKLAQQRWQTWTNEWSPSSASKQVADRLAALRQAFQAMPDIASAQSFLDHEVCINRGYYREAALRLAVERNVASYNVEVGEAANRAFREYYNDPYHPGGTCSTIK